MKKLSLKDISVKGKKVLVRVDFNVPLDKLGAITDDTRIRAALPTIQHIIEHGGVPILMSHLGRPKGKTNKEFSLVSCVRRLSTLLERPVQFVNDCIGEEVEKQVKGLVAGDVLLLENLRFYLAEEKINEDISFAKKLAKLGDVYVNDAFGSAHRTHSSTATIASYFPKKSATGFLLEKEIFQLNRLLSEPKRPFAAIIGGSKISTKITLIQALLDRADVILVGGAMMFTFLKAQGIPIGESLYEEEFLETAKDILEIAKTNSINFVLPKDFVVADAFDNGANSAIVDDIIGIPSGYRGMDIGPKTIEHFSRLLKKCRTVMWNGPMGVFEMENFAKGTRSIASILASSSAKTVVGGGDSVSAIREAGVFDKISHISTGGGATLEFFEKGTLPGIEALSNSSEKIKN